MLEDIVEARPLEGHYVHVRFEDGVEGEVNVADLVEFRGVFADLAQDEVFRQLSIHPELGTVCWPNGADLDPDVVYALVTGQRIDLD